MKRLLIATTMLCLGGAEQVAWETAKRLVTDYEVHILAAEKSPTSTEDEVRIHYVPPKRPFTLLYSTFSKSTLNAALNDISPHILHSHQILPWAYVFAKAKCTKIVTCHGLDFSETSKHPRQKYLTRPFLSSAIKNADIVCAPCKWLADCIEEKYDVDCIVLPNGVDTHIFAPTKGMSSHSNVILYVGKMLEKKGVRELFEAARALQEYEFWLIGDPKTDRVEVPSLPNIKVIGFVDHDAIASYYNQASLCVFPSYWETFSLAGLEAMACGRAIVATKLGFSEYVEHERDGLLVDPRRPDQLIESIRYLMENESTRTKMERNAREKALQYDWGIIMNRYRALYEKFQ